MKSLKLVECILADASMRCGVGTIRDFLQLRKRVEHEGESFLTITLPNFDKTFLKCLERGSVSRDDFRGFGYRQKLPKFLGKLMELVFDINTGVLLERPSEDAIYCIRQILNVYKKIKRPCTPERANKAFSDYVQVENELEHLDLASIPEFYEFGIVADFLVSRVFKDSSEFLSELRHVGNHGPGTTAERILGNKKYDFRTWHSRLEPYFPFDYFGVVNWDYLDSNHPVQFIDPGAEQPVRVIQVPKTQKAPRIIAVEPVAQQFCQQSLLAYMRPSLETHWLTRGQINFTDQKN